MTSILEYTSDKCCIKFACLFDAKRLDEQFNELHDRLKSRLNTIVRSCPQPHVIIAHSYFSASTMKKQVNYFLFETGNIPTETVLKTLLDYSAKTDYKLTCCITIQLLDIY